MAVHPSDENDVHELYLMCDDVEAFVATMKKKKIRCGPISNQRWGLLTSLALPGGGKLGVYQPLHESLLIKKKRATSARGASRSHRCPRQGRR